MNIIVNSQPLDAIKDNFLPPTSSSRSKASLSPKKSRIVKNSEVLNNTKRDMRRKLVKGTSWPSIKKRIVKKQQGGTLDNEFLDYTNVETPEVSLSELTFDTSDFNPYSYISTEPFKDETPDKISEDTSKQEQVKPAAKKEKSVVRTNITSFDFDPKLGLMGEFVKIATEEGIPFRVTSGYRPGASTSNGSLSWHSKGLALDIVPKHGVSWEAFQNHFKNSPRTLKWIRDNKFGILDETTPEMLAKTGGTGAHWHIGKDKIAIDSFGKMFPLSRKGGILKAQWGNKIYGSYVTKPGEQLSDISNKLEVPKDSLLLYNNMPRYKGFDGYTLDMGQEILWRKDPSSELEKLNSLSRFPAEFLRPETIEKTIESNIENPKSPDYLQTALNFIVGTKEHHGWEGFFEKPTLEYGSGRGIKTLGHGFTDSETLAKHNDGITWEESERMVFDLIRNKIVPDLAQNEWWEELNPNLKAALIDAHFNLGKAGFYKSKKLLNHLKNRADLKLIIAEMNWNMNANNGLGDRSGARRALAAGQYDFNYIPYSGKYKQWKY